MRARTQPRFARGSQPPANRDDSREWLTAVVRAQFPKLTLALGDILFDAVLAAYLEHDRPSLRETGTQFPEFLYHSPDYPIWYAELAALDRAHADVLYQPIATPLARRDVALDRTLGLVPAHAMVELTSDVDELWAELDRGDPPRRPRALDWPRTVLIWRTAALAIHTRSVEPDEAAALALAARGTTLVDLARAFAGDNPHKRALNYVVKWIDAGVLSR